jgi:hypothetical protein
MWNEEYKKKIALLNTTNNNEYYIRLDSYLDFIIKNPDQITGVLMKIENNLNLLNDPILEKIRDYSILRDSLA